MTYVPGRGPCYRCVFPQAVDGMVANCAEAGVLGVLPGVLGTLQATEAIKLITGTGEPLDRLGRLQRAEHARSEEHTSELQSRPHLVCRLLLEKKKHIHLHQSCLTDT